MKKYTVKTTAVIYNAQHKIPLKTSILSNTIYSDDFNCYLWALACYLINRNYYQLSDLTLLRVQSQLIRNY